MHDFTIQMMQQCTHYKESWKIGGYEQWDLFDERAFPKCSCPSFKYSTQKMKNGIITQKWCKHLDEVEKQMCTWHELAGEPQKEDGWCPRCGRPTEWVRVAV